jgi:hypothetical protein
MKIKKYIIVTLLVCIECKTLPLPLNEEHRLRAFKNRMLMKMFGLKIRFPYIPLKKREHFPLTDHKKKRTYQ